MALWLAFKYTDQQREGGGGEREKDMEVRERGGRERERGRDRRMERADFKRKSLVLHVSERKRWWG